jgi:coenzyme F420-reducing hydrogenase gamma subunit
MSVSHECRVLSSRCLCVGLITRPEESYRVCCVSECDREASKMRGPRPTSGCYTAGEEIILYFIFKVEIAHKVIKAIYLLFLFLVSNLMMFPLCRNM